MVTGARAAVPDHPAIHAPVLHNPWFADDEGVTLHRYFDEQFVARFLQEAQGRRLTATRAQEWYSRDRFGRADAPTLRLPLHKTFYVACCEVSCDVYPDRGSGQPAFDPARIGSAGFVVRRRTAGGEAQRWMVHDGQPLGWQGGTVTDQEPDTYRRLVASRVIPPGSPDPSYSGEETHPLHTLLVRGKHAAGAVRSHTLLWGYLPLGGSYRVARGEILPSEEAAAALANELSWPFGERERRPWSAEQSRPAFGGYASPALCELLETLLMRYRIFDRDDPENDPLRRLLAEISFYPKIVPLLRSVPFDAYAEPPADSRGESLLSWIEGSRDALLQWLGAITAGTVDTGSALLPRQTGTGEDGAPVATSRDDDLYITEQQAEALRGALVRRGGRTMVQMEEGLAMPRFGQGDDDLFFIVPFVRWTDPCGCERIRWGARTSVPFRVTSPFDPEAQRPHAVILPGLADLRRGSARGVTLLAPKSLADLLRRIKPTMAAGKGGPDNRAGLCWSFSFSIPAITICAMIMLMIMVNVLNIFFFWLPWALIALPRLCGKLAHEDKS